MSKLATDGSAGLRSDLASVLGEEAVAEPERHYLHDATEARGLIGSADAVVLPTATQQVADAMAYCYAHDVPITPRGGGTGFAGGAVPLHGGLVIDLARMNRVRSLDPLLWRAHVEAGLLTSDVQRLARENGLLFPPDPGAAEQSQIGGNIATNAGGPHAFKYGVTGRWVMGLEAVVPPGDVIEVGGAVRKDAAGYDLRNLLIGSEGTLGIITAAWLRLLPMPAAAFPVVGLFSSTAAGCEAIETVLGLGIDVAALEYLDAATLGLASQGFPFGSPPEGAFAVIAETDGDEDAARRARDELLEAWSPLGLEMHSPEQSADVEALWRWRDGVSLAVHATRGGKLSEDIVVPLDKLRDAIEGTLDIGARHRLPTCSWGHAGDGNLHSTFLVDPKADDELARAEKAAEELFRLAISLGGSISGEHGLGSVKGGQLHRQWNPAAVHLHEGIKHAFDPRGLLNPGKKQP